MRPPAHDPFSVRSVPLTGIDLSENRCLHRCVDARVEKGQAAVEFAMALPLIVVVLLAITQVGVSVRNEVAVELAAREGARAAAVSADPAGAATAAAARAVRLPIEVSTSSDGNRVSVTVTYVDPTDIAIIGAAIGPITHQATATMAVEPP